jgi:hypothetical protein
MERIDRGELFALGKNYINTQIPVEFHPFLNFYFNTINNIKDPSCILQPRLSYSMTQNSTLSFSGQYFLWQQGKRIRRFPDSGNTLLYQCCGKWFSLVYLFF